MERLTHGFAPVFDENSKVLILGSFPSVKSRAISFYYGNKQNRFWKTVCSFFGEEIPPTTEGKIAFLKGKKIALWDMAEECDIIGSSDASIKNVKTVDLHVIFRVAKIEKILLNGTLAYDLFLKTYENIQIPFYKMPSTSPANPRFDKSVWEKALNDLREFD
jgi:hypoxanthine-DNA glycosylase